MSLQVWLPLNGDLHNQGLSNIQPTNNGATINTNGKIGKCYNVNNSMGIIVNSSITLGTTFSITCWIKINSYNQDWANAFKIYKDGYDYIGLCMNQANATTKQLGFHIYKNNGSNARTGVTDNYYIPLTVGKWYHLCFVVIPTQVITYQDGVKIKTNNITTNFPSITNYNLSLGKSSLFSGLDCSINDFRLYNHALTAKEAEEISKGLVLHYKLNNNSLGNENLVTGSNTNSTSTNKWGASSAVGGNSSAIEQDNTGIYCVKITRNNTAQSSWDYLYYDSLLRNKIKTNTKYTISFDCKPSVDGSISFVGFANGNATNYMTNSTTTIQGNCKANQWNHMIYQCTTINSFNDITVSGQLVYFSRSASLRGTNVIVLFKNIKVEEGTVETPWCPAITDSLYTSLNNNSNIIYDSSGYNNNGTVVGTLETITPSPKYSCATFFDNKEYIIHKLPENMYQATYSFWVKASSYTGYGAVYMPYQSPSAGTSPWFAINTESCKVWAYFGNNSPNYTKGSGTMPLNEWHHCVYVWNNGVAQWYVDGEKNGNSVTYTGRTFIQNTANATIGNSFTGTNWNGTPFNGQISDFRVYATALTAAQIKELYKTSMIVNGTSVVARDLE